MSGVHSKYNYLFPKLIDVLKNVNECQVVRRGLHMYDVIEGRFKKRQLKFLFGA